MMTLVFGRILGMEEVESGVWVLINALNAKRI